MFSRLGLCAVGLIYLVNGAWMIAAPNGWYWAIAGVAATGPMNPHFMADIGLAFLASGVGLLMGLRAGATAAAFAVAGATWPVLHALFHVWLWLAHGFPRAADIAAIEVISVVGPAALGAALAFIRARQEGV